MDLAPEAKMLVDGDDLHIDVGRAPGEDVARSRDVAISPKATARVVPTINVARRSR